MNENDSTRLRDMLTEAQRVQKFATGKGRDDLFDDDMLAYAIVRCLEIIGEAASHVTPETRNECPQLALASNCWNAQSHCPRLFWG